MTIESDKRLASDGNKRAETQFLNARSTLGDVVEYALLHDLYILAATNQENMSV